MQLILKQVLKNESESLLLILSDAEEDDELIRSALLQPANTNYAFWLDGQLVGAAVVRWEGEVSEIVYIAVASNLRGRGYGKEIISLIQEEMLKHRSRSLLVGTGNSSLENIAFYQKCGFRMYEVRRDYFDYIRPPISEHGIMLRDMLVLRYDVD